MILVMRCGKIVFHLALRSFSAKRAIIPRSAASLRNDRKPSRAVRGAFAMNPRETHPDNRPAEAFSARRFLSGYASPLAGGGEPLGEPTPWKLGPNEAKWGNPAPIRSRAKNSENPMPGLCLPRSGNIRPSGANPPKILSQKPSGYEPDALEFFLRHRNPLRSKAQDARTQAAKRPRGTPRGTRHAIRGTRR